MAPNKFEKHIQKQLENREIQPSSEAWMKLSERLDETVIVQPKRKSYFWYAVAACFVGLIMFSVVMFTMSSSNSESISPVVENERDAIEEANDFQEVDVKNNAVEVVATENIPKEKQKSNTQSLNIEVAKEKEVAQPLANTSKNTQAPLKDESEEIINTKVLEVLAQVDILEQDNEALTNAEVDSLLRKAQEEILMDKLFRNNQSVDAMALLSEVESELDTSFRDQIFESLKNGFVKVRTAVADRNN